MYKIYIEFTKIWIFFQTNLQDVGMGMFYGLWAKLDVNIRCSKIIVSCHLKLVLDLCSPCLLTPVGPCKVIGSDILWRFLSILFLFLMTQKMENPFSLLIFKLIILLLFRTDKGHFGNCGLSAKAISSPTGSQQHLPNPLYPFTSLRVNGHGYIDFGLPLSLSRRQNDVFIVVTVFYQVFSSSSDTC